MQNNSRNFKNNEASRIIAGIILVAAGGVLLLKAMGFLFPWWLFTWPVILIVVGIYTAIKHNFKNNSWIFLVVIGSFFLFNEIVPGLGLEPYFWPLIIIGAGLMFILRPAICNNRDKNTGADNATFMQTSTKISTDGPDVFSGSEYLKITSIFSGVNRSVLNKNFTGAHITSVFGGTEIDLTQADFTATATIKTEIIFGGVKLIVPPHWTVVNHIDGIFHGVDDKRRFNAVTDINPSKVLLLKGSVIFGGIEIRNA